MSSSEILSGRTSDNPIVGINYIVWDPTTRELSFRPADSLEQYTTYALVATTGVRDSRGNAIGEAESIVGIANDPRQGRLADMVLPQVRARLADHGGRTGCSRGTQRKIGSTPPDGR